MKRLLSVVSVAIALLIAGCSMTTPKPQKGGSASTAPANTVESHYSPETGESTATITPHPDLPPTATITQPENPKGSSAQSVKHEAQEIIEISVDTVNKTVTEYPDGRKVTVEQPIPAGSKVIKSVKSDVKQELGGTWIDTAREISAKLGSFRYVQYVGIFLIIAAGAMFHPVIRAAVGGGKEIQMIAAGVGLLFVFGPALLVGNEKLILVGGAVVLGGGYLLTRTSYYKGKVDSAKDSASVDAKTTVDSTPPKS